MEQNNEHNKEGLKTVYSHTVTLFYGIYAGEAAQVKRQGWVAKFQGNTLLFYLIINRFNDRSFTKVGTHFLPIEVQNATQIIDLCTKVSHLQL